MATVGIVSRCWLSLVSSFVCSIHYRYHYITKKQLHSAHIRSYSHNWIVIRFLSGSPAIRYIHLRRIQIDILTVPLSSANHHTHPLKSIIVVLVLFHIPHRFVAPVISRRLTCRPQLDEYDDIDNSWRGSRRKAKLSGKIHTINKDFCNLALSLCLSLSFH